MVKLRRMPSFWFQVNALRRQGSSAWCYQSRFIYRSEFPGIAEDYYGLYRRCAGIQESLQTEITFPMQFAIFLTAEPRRGK